MPSSKNETPARSGLSLYANLLESETSSSPSTGATISRAPIAFNQEAQDVDALNKPQINAGRYLTSS